MQVHQTVILVTLFGRAFFGLAETTKAVLQDEPTAYLPLLRVLLAIYGLAPRASDLKYVMEEMMP